jgi:hypothetical protein
VKPATILAWLRELAARKYDSSRSKTGRPRKTRDIRKLVIDLALANEGWGYTKIRNQFIFFGERHLRDVIREFGHYHTECFHQGLGGQLLKSQPGSANDNGSNGSIACHSRLGGLLNYYHRAAA